MNKLKRDIKYLIEIVNDKFEDVEKCERGCPYNYGCNELIKLHGVSLCGAIECAIKNN